MRRRGLLEAWEQRALEAEDALRALGARCERAEERERAFARLARETLAWCQRLDGYELIAARLYAELRRIG